MGDLRPSHEEARLPVHEVRLAGLQRLLYPLDALEPGELEGARSVGEPGREAAAPLLARGLDAGDDAGEQDVLGLRGDLGDGADARLVDVAVGEMVQQVAEGVDAQLLPEQVGPQRTDALEVFDGIGQYGGLARDLFPVKLIRFKAR